jgi:hypothetical protein
MYSSLTFIFTEGIFEYLRALGWHMDLMVEINSLGIEDFTCP